MSRRALFVCLVLIITVVLAGVLTFSRQAPESAPLPAEPAGKSVAFKRQVIGQSVEGRAIEAFTFGTGARELLFIGGIHGGYEWNSVLLAYQFIDYFSAQPEQVPSSLRVTIIPNLNPDGVYKVIKKEGRFALADVPSGDASPGRFNAHNVDLNRNFACKWQAQSAWRGQPVSTGLAAFSEPESRALRDYVLASRPSAVVFWHSQAGAVYASECEAGILPETRAIMSAYAKAAGYQAVETFDAYPITGDAEGWLASIDVPAITVELTTHESVEWEQNLAGVRALLQR